MTAVTPEHRAALRRLALNDEDYLASVLTHYSGVGARDAVGSFQPALSDRTRRLVDVAALIAVGSGPTGIDAGVSAAFGAGATAEDIVEVLLSIAPAVGSARVVSAAPHVAAAIGYDMDVDLEGALAGAPREDRVFER